MSESQAGEIAEILNRVRDWPPGQRVTLARGILETLEDAESEPGGRRRGGPTAEQVRTLLRVNRPGPDDETVRRWIDEHRMEKYG